ncbi:hypothetical protein [Absidia glauca]|uniref:S-adenosylmethionine transporter n=1 Tax=Absidia glauca TaxID=4829 RepID=A0A163JAA6_ABSGL|nr:hypothetical protein [Absidia glauca]
MSNSTEVETMEVHNQGQRNLKQALLAGGMAGTAVDTVLFPLDTIKTRLQSQAGFMASGGMRGVYSGLLAAVVGSAPSASLFFVTYEAAKRVLSTSIDPTYTPLIHMVAASCGLYRGFLSTVAREIPFCCIQFPLYEYFKRVYACHYGRPAEPYQAALCGSVAGGIAAAITTPLDVCKTRIMLSSKNQNIQQYTGILSTMKRVAAEEGPRALLSGLGPRVMWISIGGSIFLGVYEKALKTCTQLRLLEDERHY